MVCMLFVMEGAMLCMGVLANTPRYVPCVVGLGFFDPDVGAFFRFEKVSVDKVRLCLHLSLLDGGSGEDRKACRCAASRLYADVI